MGGQSSRSHSIFFTLSGVTSIMTWTIFVTSAITLNSSQSDSVRDIDMVVSSWCWHILCPMWSGINLCIALAIFDCHLIFSDFLIFRYCFVLKFVFIFLQVFFFSVSSTFYPILSCVLYSITWRRLFSLLTWALIKALHNFISVGKCSIDL